MKKAMDKLKYEVKGNRKMYFFLFTIVIMGIICGAIFITVLNETDIKLVNSELTNFFNLIKNDQKLPILTSLKNSLISNYTYVFLVWFLGLSIIGIAIIILILFIKGFVMGFSVSAIIDTLGLNGIGTSIMYVFPHQIINLLILTILGFYGLSISASLAVAVFKKKTVSFKNMIARYVKLLIFSLIIVTMCSLFEVFIMPYLLKIFI